MFFNLPRRFGGKRAASITLACSLGALALGMLLLRAVALAWRVRPGAAIAQLPHRNLADQAMVWAAYLLLWIALIAIMPRSGRLLRPRWLIVAFVITLASQTLASLAQFHSFGTAPPRLIDSLKLVALLGAVITAIGLPMYLQRLRTYISRADLVEQSEARLTVTTDSSIDAIFIFDKVADATGQVFDFRFSFVNRNAERMVGRPRSEFIGQRLGELYPAVRSAGRIEQFRKVLETGEPLEIEIQSAVLFSGNTPAYCRLQVMKLDQGVVVTCTDLTSSRLATQELKRALAFNKAIVLSSPFNIIVTDRNGRITSVNPAAERMLLYRAEELCGQSVLMLHDMKELVERAEELSAELKTPVAPTFEVLRVKADLGMVDEREWTYVRKNGTRVPVQMTISAVEDERGSVIGLMGMSYDLTDRKEADEYIYHLAHHDTLTGLPGRSLLRDRLEVAVERGKRFQILFAVLMIDLDHFKRVNDSLGHQAGDIVLCEIAERLKRLLRGVDTIARFGGDEFLVVLSEIQSRQHAEQVAHKIIQTIAPPVRVFGHDIPVTASVGISIYPDSLTPDELIRHAGIAMYRSKALGRNGAVAFTPELGKELIHRLSMESSLRQALEREEFFLVYQPQVSLDTAELTGVEALIRWRNPELGLLMPGEFIPIAEESGMIVEIGAWAMRTACRQMAELEKTLGRKLMVAVNVSPRQVHQQDFQSTIQAALTESGLDPSRLELEITEHLLMRDSEESLEIFERVQALGVSTAIDDFGTGFSNMSYITRFKVDRLKIDRTFVSRCAEDANSLAVTTAIIALAHSLKMKVVAEGVETVEQASALRGLRCDFGQGYLYARPLEYAALQQYALSERKSVHLKAV
jgi:diguanylate cyclase (GGDEF)-like protein/PAS domain S-box-containing protein